MISPRSPDRRARSRIRALMLALLLSSGHARADDGPATCDDTFGSACGCEQEASCWDFAFLSSGKTALLGLTSAVTAVTASDPGGSVDIALLASYRADAYRASGLLNSHVSASGAIGAGSAGNHGALAGAIDFGVRVPASRESGPILRVGPNARLVGSDALELTFVEPLRLSAGFQQLLGDTLLEAGLTSGLLGAGRFAAAQRSASLTGSLAIGHYVAAHYAAFRFDGRVIYVRPSPFGAEVRMGIVELDACAHARSVAVCIDLQYVQSRLPPPLTFADRAGSERDTVRAVIAGLTLGLTP